MKALSGRRRARLWMSIVGAAVALVGGSTLVGSVGDHLLDATAGVSFFSAAIVWAGNPGRGLRATLALASGLAWFIAGLDPAVAGLWRPVAALAVVPEARNLRWGTQWAASMALAVAAVSQATDQVRAEELLVLIAGASMAVASLTAILRDRVHSPDRPLAVAGGFLGVAMAVPSFVGLADPGQPGHGVAVLATALLTVAGTCLLFVALADPGSAARVTDRVIELSGLQGTAGMAGLRATGGWSASAEEAYGAGVAMLEANRALLSDLERQLERRRRLQRRLLLAAAVEHAQLAEQLDDVVLPLLDELTAMLQVVGPDAVRPALREIQDTREDLDRIARGLHPKLLSANGLGPALQDLAVRAPIKVAVTAPSGRFDLAVEATIWYVCAEALTNTIKHSGATLSTIQVELVGDQLVATVQDDGRCHRGTALGAQLTGGLAGVRDRVAACGGTLEIAVTVGGGVSIVARVPRCPP